MTHDLIHVTLLCNSRRYELDIPADRLLVDVLREELGLTGTKRGCATGNCGSCTILLDGESVNSCLVYAAECGVASIDTVEGLVGTTIGQTVIDELVKKGAVQCGFCSPGVVALAVALLSERGGQLDESVIKLELAGNLCRCTGYFPIVEAIRSAAAKLRAATDGSERR